ncbi:MAG: hypothetical protein CMM90_02545 [Rickettsiales bacterium]|nr:hypothetical protein [Rickettsiales bacterium]|tara:strand:- start:5993 stop:6655 length:663 start_codon:yes stop_codon:yes gene_type:complete
MTIEEIKPMGEMTEKNLLKTVSIFWPEGNWQAQVRFNYDPCNKRKYYLVDCCSVEKKIVFEYEGPDHYENVWKLRRDEQRAEYFTQKGYSFLRWPYYCQLTKDVAKHFFKESFNENKYTDAIKTVYKVTEEQYVLSPGIHTSKNTPANYVARGVSRFFDELNSFPRSVKAQVAETLRRYIQGVDDPYLIVGEGDVFQTLLKTPISKKELDVYFHRKLETN